MGEPRNGDAPVDQTGATHRGVSQRLEETRPKFTSSAAETATHNDTFRVDVALAQQRGYESKFWRNTRPTWGEVLQWVEGPLPAEKADAYGYVFGKLAPRDGQRSIRRTRDSVVYRTALTLDADHAVPDDFVDRVAALGVEALVHTTASSTPSAPRYRVIIPTHDIMPPEEFRLATGELMARLGADMWDPGSDQPERFMYKPTAPKEGQFCSWHLHGALLDAAPLVAAARARPAAPAPVVREVDLSTPPTEQELDKAQNVLAKAAQSYGHDPKGKPTPGRNEWVTRWATPLLGFVKGGFLTREEVEETLWAVTERAPGDPTWDRGEFNEVIKHVWRYVQPTRPDVDTPEDVFTVVERPAAPPDRPLRIGPAYPPGRPMANARLLLRRSPPICRWRGDWYTYQDGVYVPCDEDLIRAVAYHAFENASYERANGEDAPWTPDSKNINALIDALKAVAYKSERSEPDTRWMNLTNGLLDPRTGALAPHSPDVFSLVRLPYAYDPAATCPEWLRTLEDVFSDDPETVKLVQEIFGYVVTGRTDLQKIFYLLGPRRGFKGTLIRVLTALVGRENVAAPPLTAYTEHFGLAGLIGKTLAATADARFGRGLDIQTLTERWLTISGEDAISVPRKHRADWVGQLGARILVASNESPPLRDASTAVVSRLVLVRFTKSYLGKEDFGLGDRLVRELPGILNWALAGAARLAKTNRFTLPESSAAVLQELENEASPIAAFVAEEGCVGPGERVPCQDFIDRFNAWAVLQGLPPASARAVGAAVRSAFPTVERKKLGPKGAQKWVYHGLGLQG